MAGVPAIVKPATVTPFLTESVVKAIHNSAILPPGHFSSSRGSARATFSTMWTNEMW